MYTFIFDLAQLERAHDLAARGILRIIHILCEDGSVVDRYVTVIHCTPQQAMLLDLL